MVFLEKCPFYTGHRIQPVGKLGLMVSQTLLRGSYHK